MRIHGLYLVKNEKDVVCDSLAAASNWCDNIYVFDNGSTDGTWQLVQEIARNNPHVVPFKQDTSPFCDGLRSDIFESYRSEAKAGDWWCRLDADEFYVDNPKEFLTSVPASVDLVWAAMFSYYFTDRDATRYEQDPALFQSDGPVQERLRYYVNHWSELRLFRHRRTLVWTRKTGFPEGLSAREVYSRRIRVKHFPYRSPAQIECRLDTRRAAIRTGEFQHEAVEDWGEAVASVRQKGRRLEEPGAALLANSWRDRVVPSTFLEFDDLDGDLKINEELMPALPIPVGGLLRKRMALEHLFKRLPPVNKVRVRAATKS